jgi:hypothetical protein
MGQDLKEFEGILPYATELFGIFHPLIGWKSLRTKGRIAHEQAQTIEAVTEGMEGEYQIRKADYTEGSLVRPDITIHRSPPWMSEVVASQLRHKFDEFRKTKGRGPTKEEMPTLVRGLKLKETIKALAEYAAANGGTKETLVLPRRGLSQQQRSRLQTVDIPGTDYVATKRTAGMEVAAEIVRPISISVQAGTLDYLAEMVPQAIVNLVKVPNWKALLPWIDPLSQFDPETQDAILSPIGLIQLYRQYFFEFDSFLGPPVGHVWVSPGGSLELYEIHTRKTLEQHAFESSLEIMSRSEKMASMEDELATKIARENTSNTSMGATVSGGVDLGVFQANASAQFGYNSTQRLSQEEAHKRARTQSEKISNEMRRDFKTTFRTSVETQDTSSRRYVLANSTDKLVNYEFRRKMRKVGVQLQHLGTQLCWQIYVDEPGWMLGVSELVHIAKRGDLSAAILPPDAPVLPTAKTTQFSVTFPFKKKKGGGSGDEMYYYGNDKDGSFDEDDRIYYQRTYKVVPPPDGHGYKLAHVRQLNVRGSTPDEDPPSVVVAGFKIVDETSFKLTLQQVNFNDQPALVFDLEATWDPSKEQVSEIEAAYKGKLSEYEQKKSRAQHEEYVRAVRERVRLASNITPRSSTDLRAEERITIFQRLIALLRSGAVDETSHVTVELIRGIFDVDKMLYFVAETWWKARSHKSYGQQFDDDNSTEVLTPDDTVGWGGRDSQSRDNYYLTEDSQPAPMGASLGWLLQLDGDQHRNAFLNSPFVKAVIPIRPGKEEAAIKWLERSHVEGSEGLDTPYRGSEPEFAGKTLREVLSSLSKQIHAEQIQADSALATETVYERGFKALTDGFVAAGKPFKVFDQWIEVLPTEQTVAVEYKLPTNGAVS